MLDDHQLLRRYASDGSEAAFGELVARYVNLVYSAAFRRTGGDAELAKDVAQLVFTDLARKARSLPERVVLAGWLHRATRFAAAQLLRTERRRQAREQEAVTMNALTSESAPDWDQIRPLLDEALDRLDHADRDALLLRFFEQRSLAEVGSALGANEDAARKRVSRALERIRADLIRRGVTTTAAALSAAISINAVQMAPAGFAAALTSASLASAVAGGGTALTFLKIMTMTKLQTAIIGAIVAAGVATPLVMQQRQTQTKLHGEIGSLRQQIVELQNDNDSLSNQTVQAISAQLLSKEQLSELLRLRGEVGLLRQQTNELANLRRENRQLHAGLAAGGDSRVATSPLPTAAPPSSTAPFQLHLVLDDTNVNAEAMTNNVKTADGKTVQETLYVQRTPLMDYTAIKSANVVTDALGAPRIEILFTDRGREQFAAITKENLNKRLAIAIDGQSYSTPMVREEITDGKAEISGSFTEAEARELAAKINDALNKFGHQ